MTLPENIRNEIIECLAPLHLQKIILFGSYAYGTPHQDSDLDLLVVTDEDFMPANYKEKSAIYLKVATHLRNLERKIPIDLIVHTRSMYGKFTELNSMFCRKIKRDGVVLYDKHGG